MEALIDLDSCSCEVYGSGFGSGYGDGDGFGSGISQFCGTEVQTIDGIPTIIDIWHGDVARGRILRDDLTTAPCYIARQGSVYAHGNTLRNAMDALRSKLYEGMPEDERIAAFIASHEWGQKYQTKDLYQWHHNLTGSCEMGRNAFAQSHGFTLADDETLTVEEFIALTENSYGGDVIRKLRDAYNEGGKKS